MDGRWMDALRPGVSVRWLAGVSSRAALGRLEQLVVSS
jgi:hypothetical protein